MGGYKWSDFIQSDYGFFNPTMSNFTDYLDKFKLVNKENKLISSLIH